MRTITRQYRSSRRAGRAGADLAPTLSRLLKLKTKSQYTPVSVTPSDAVRAVLWAQRLMTGAEDVFAGRCGISTLTELSAGRHAGRRRRR